MMTGDLAGEDVGQEEDGLRGELRLTCPDCGEPVVRTRVEGRDEMGLAWSEARRLLALHRLSWCPRRTVRCVWPGEEVDR